MYLYILLNIFCSLRRLEAVTFQEYLLKYVLLHFLIISIKPIFFSVSALNSVYLDSVKGQKAINLFKLSDIQSFEKCDHFTFWKCEV